MKQHNNNLSKGQAMMILLVLFFVVSSSAVIGAVSPTVRVAGVAKENERSKKSYFLAESGIEDVIHRLKHGMQTSSSEEITIDDTSVTTTVNNLGGNDYTLESLGDTENRIRKVSTSITTAAGFSFSYGVQVGAGGFDLSGNAGVIGNVYANGPIVGANGSFITGTAVSAGETGLIDGVDDIGTEEEGGDAYAHTVTGVSVIGNLFCQTGSNNNKSCDTSQEDPEPQAFPVTEEDITTWQTQAGAGTVIDGDYAIEDDIVSIGPVIITGNLSIANNAQVNVTGTVWVQGNLILNNNVEISLDSSYGSEGEIFLVDGYVHISNNATFDDSGTEGSYIMLITTSTCPDGDGCDGFSAIDLDNNVGTVILNAQEGTIFFRNNAGAVSATADTIALNNNATIVYEQGLINVYFNSGPSGTFAISDWGETE